MMRRLLFVILLNGWLALEAPAGLVVTKLNTPRHFGPGVGAFPMEPTEIDFDGDERVDFRFFPHSSGISAYIPQDARVVVRFDTSPNRVGGAVAGLPLNFWFGETNRLSGYRWWNGFPVMDPEQQIYGDRILTVMIFLTQPVNPEILVVNADIRFQNSAVGVEFLIGTNKHYGYIHVDMRQEHDYLLGAGGYIYGWAYETEPGKPIFTAPIAVPAVPARSRIVNLNDGGFNVCWRGTIGGLYRVQGSPVAQGAYLDFTPDIAMISTNGCYTVDPPAGASSYFWRVVRMY